MTTWNKRMLLLMDHCIESKLVSTQKEFLQSIGASITILNPVKSGVRSFTVKQIYTAAKKYSINANWILGLDNNMKAGKSRSAIQNLKDAVKAIETEYLK